MAIQDAASSPEAPLPASLTPFPWSTAAQSLGMLGIVGSSLGLFVQTMRFPAGALANFLEKNSLPKLLRREALLGLLVGAVLMMVAGGAHLLWWRRRGVESLQRLTDLVTPLGLAFMLPSLFSYNPWHATPLPFLVQLTVFVLALEWALGRALAAIPSYVYDALAEATALSPAWTRRLPLLVVAGGALFYSVYFSYYTILNHHRLGTAGYDLGINVNWMYNALHGHPFQSTVLFGMDGGNFIGNHAIFAMFLWLPVYAIHPGAEILLIFQSTIVGFAAVTLYLFASTQIPRWSAALLSILYLFFAPLHGPNFYDYHELLPAIFWHFLLYWAIAKERYRLLWILVPIIYAHREDVAVGVAILGLFLLVTGKRPRIGALLLGVSVVWFYLIKFVIMPRLWSTWFATIYKELQAEGESGYGTIVQTILINPSYFLTTLLKEVKANYFFHMFTPLALLPARKPALLLLAIPGFFFTLMTTAYAPTISIAFQYTTHWVPYLFAATVLMLRVIGQGPDGALRRRAVLGAMAVAMLSHSYVFGAILQHHTFVGGFNKIVFTMTPEEEQRYRDLKRLAAMIPRDASVAATENECPHVAARMLAYTLKDGSVEAEYVLINAQKINLGNTRNNLKKMFSKAPYGLVAKGSRLFLFKRNHESPDTEAAKLELGIPLP
jgi:uncharacterized membrane protein